MTPERRAKLEAAGHTVATAEDFFGLDEVDRAIVRLRLAAAAEVRRLREEQGLTQRELAERIEVSQSRIVGIEKGRNASLDAILTAYVALGGGLPDFGPPEPPEGRRRPRRQSKQLGPVRRPGGMAKGKSKSPPGTA